jgi:hypothetical protein
MLGIPNDMLETMSSSYGNAKDWVKENATVYGNKLKLKYISQSRHLNLSQSHCEFIPVGLSNDNRINVI